MSFGFQFWVCILSVSFECEAECGCECERWTETRRSSPGGLSRRGLPVDALEKRGNESPSDIVKVENFLSWLIKKVAEGEGEGIKAFYRIRRVAGATASIFPDQDYGHSGGMILGRFLTWGGNGAEKRFLYLFSCEILHRIIFYIKGGEVYIDEGRFFNLYFFKIAKRSIRLFTPFFFI